MATQTETGKKLLANLKKIQEKLKEKEKKKKSSRSRTKIHIVSDSPDDKGKTFNGKTIETPEEYESHSSSGGSSNRIKIVSDSPSDEGKTFNGKTINKPEPSVTNKPSTQNRVDNFINSIKQGNSNEKNTKKLYDNNDNPIVRAIINSTKFGNSGEFNNKRNNMGDTGSNSDSPLTSINSNLLNSLPRPKTPIQETTILKKDYNEILNKPKPRTTQQIIEDTSEIRPTPAIKYNKTWAGNLLDKAGDWLKEKTNKYTDIANKENLKYDDANVLKTTGARAAAFAGGLVIGAKELIIDPVRTPLETTRTVLETPVILTVNPSARQDAMSQVANFGQKLKAGDPQAMANVAVGVVTLKLPSALELTAKASGKTYKAVKFAGKTELPQSDFVHPDVISKTTKFPTVDSTDKIFSMMDEAGNSVVTFSPQKLSKVDPKTGTPTLNPFKGENIAGDTRKGALGLEDGGINVAPKGSGNSEFLRISGSSGSSKYTLDPAKILDSIKNEFRIPTVTEFKTQGVVTPPKKVLNEPGFDAVKQWQINELAGSGKTAVTKRGMIGKGELPSQEFINPTTGRKTFEKGTGEIELTIPQNQKFKDNGIDSYIIVDGQKVAVRKAELILDNSKNINNIDKANNIISGDKILKEQKHMSSMLDNSKYKSPYSKFNSGLKYMGSIQGKSSIELKSLVSEYSIKKPISGGLSINSNIFRNPNPNPKPKPSGGEYVGGISNPSNPNPKPSGGGGGGIPNPFKPNPRPFYGGGAVFGGNVPLKNPYPNLKRKQKPKQQTQQKYNVVIKRKGKTTMLNKQPLPMTKATSLGRNVVDNTVARSFEVRPVGGGKIQKTTKAGEKFRMRKTKNALFFVEKSKYSIDTSGEKKGLSVSKFLSNKLLETKGGFKL